METNLEIIMLKARLEALHSQFTSMLPVVYDHCEDAKDRTWLAKYCLYRNEREILDAYSCRRGISSLAKEKISHRRFQLQVLMDVAYIQGGLEGYDIFRVIQPDSYRIATSVYERSDGSEETMLPLIDEFYT